jgi:hypothetical protein
MTAPVGIVVALSTSRGYRTITGEVADITYGSTSPGGFAECTVTLYRPISFTPNEVAQFGRLYVFDSRHGGILYEGRLQDPGRTAGNDGQSYQLAAVGGQAHLQDDTRMLYYVDIDPTSWVKTDPGGTRAGTVVQESDNNAAGDPALVLRIPQGTSVDGAIPSRVVAHHRGISQAGQKLARVAFTWDAGLTTPNLTMSLYAGTYGLGPADVPYSTTFTTAGASVGRIVDPGAGSSAWSNGRNWPILRFHYTGAAGNVTADTWWLEITNLVVRTMLYAKDGVEITDYSTGTNPAYGSNNVYAWQIVEDLLGRMLTATVDGANATVVNTGYAIDHLIYPDGANPAKVLEDLLVLEPAYTYHLWESNPLNGKFRFEWILWPTTVRYEADVNDGFSAPASGNTVFNRVGIRYRNRGVTQFAIRTQSVPMLTAAGFDRTDVIDLGDEAASSANAAQAGDQFLAEHAQPTNAGRLVIRRPIVDYRTGRMVMPRELRAGELIRVKGVESYPDSLNTDGRDGLTVFKIAATTYSSSDDSATLDLDSYAPSVARALAKIKRKGFTRRR